MELPTSPNRCLAIAMLRAIGFLQKDTARITRCANQTVVDTERWLREEDYHNVARICDDQSIKKMVTTEAIYWGLKEEDLVKLDRLTQDDILRHYRADYLKIADISDPRFLKHTADVLNLLDTYVSQLEVAWEPEDFVTPSEGAPPNEEESAFWFFAKKAVPSLETLIDSQIDSESLTLAPVLERQPEFEALTGHYEGTKLWQQIVTYKQEGGKYVSIGAKLHKTILKLIDRVFAEETKAGTFRSALTELIREDLAPVRVKLHLEGVEADKVLSRLPDADFTSLLQGTELLQSYLNDRGAIEAQEDQKLFAELQSLLTRITEIYQLLKTKERDILRGIKEEKFKGQLPAGSKCKFCPTISGNGISG